MVLKLLELGFDINSTCGRDSTDSPIKEAIRCNRNDIVLFLLDQPNITVTNYARMYENPNRLSRTRCDPTALSIAAGKGNLKVVQWLIDAGALDLQSTPRCGDPYSPFLYTSGDSVKLVHLSVNEAIYEAYTAFETWKVQSSPEIQADILELLLLHSGAQRLNAISMYILYRLREGDPGNSGWSDFSNRRGYSYNLVVDNDFDRETGAASLRVKAIVRGLRFLSIECFRAAGIKLSHEGSTRLDDKEIEWNDIVKTCRNRLKAEDSGDPPNGCIRRRQFLRWCKVFCQAFGPWSREKHQWFPKHARVLARDLLPIGRLLAKKHNAAFLNNLWETEIMPSLIC